MAKKPRSLGRQKIKIAKIEIKNHLQVTFSKRRFGLFKKASELCTLCGVELAILVLSPAGKVFSFSHPNIDSIINRFLTKSPPPNPSWRHLVEAHQNANLHELNLQLARVLDELEAEKRRGGTLDHLRKAREYWWEGPIDGLGLHELEQLRDSLEELKKNVIAQAYKLFIEGTTNPKPFFLVNGIEMANGFESKSTQISASSTIPHVHSVGYNHGFF
ncbi:agamous-like MADS-box protein AGL62 [Diospyros lotus]|uniref:agamous-like MADS-box protein AGL62 n=1 Tax=Diospyros lotus TaxID=55363 RepID=UPI0022546472|nr:agamous-like MADS-box protein AGL62 [Diospyros lotus]